MGKHNLFEGIAPGDSHNGKWFLPSSREEVADCLEDMARIMAFLSSTLSQEVPPYEFRLSDDAAVGLYYLHIFMEETLNLCVDRLVKGNEK